MGNNPIIALDPDGGHIYNWQMIVSSMMSEWNEMNNFLQRRSYLFLSADLYGEEESSDAFWIFMDAMSGFNFGGGLVVVVVLQQVQAK